MTASTKFPTALWLPVAGAWLALALFDATQTLVTMQAEGMHHAWVTLFVVTAAGWAAWALATPAVLAVWRRFRLPSRKPAAWLAHGALCLTIGAVWTAWTAFLESATNPFAYAAGSAPFLTLWRDRFFGSVVGDVIIYGAIISLSIAVETSVRLARQEAASARMSELLAQTQLAALRLQIEPHFIFNSLNAVTGLIREGRSNDAIAMIAALGDLLRRVTDRSDRQFVALEEEGAFLHKYLEIQQMRFAERLRYRVDIPDELTKAQVPDFILQPVVENAIKHGIAKRAKGGEVKITAVRAGNDATLTLSVYNEGPPLPEQIREGVGTANARQRLTALYGSDYTLTMQNQDAGVLVTITLPWRES